jgi:hypothetical protein
MQEAIIIIALWVRKIVSLVGITPGELGELNKEEEGAGRLGVLATEPSRDRAGSFEFG